jgi:hypothetical protein
MQLYPTHTLNGHQIRHLNTLALMIYGIIQGKSCQMEKIAREIPVRTQVESRTRRFSRVTQHEAVTPEIFFLPFIMPLLQSLANRGTLILAIDGSETGRKCMTLMVSVIYRKRAIPIAWLVVKGSKGHLAEDIHLDLIAQVSQIITYDCQVIFLGDGEFDGTGVQEALSNLGWHYVLRTAKNAIVNDDGDEFSLKDISLAPGQLIEIPDVELTREYYGPVTVILWWHRDYDKPIYLVTNMDCSEEACSFYRKRYRIETFFSDQKSRGFNLHKSHQSNPERLSRLLIAACLAYIWMIYLGTLVQNDSWVMKQIHRADRCDLSLFQIGLRYLEFLLNRDMSIPFSFLLPVS